MAIKNIKIRDKDDTGHYSITEIEDFEFIDPVKQISDMFIFHNINFERSILEMSGFPFEKPFTDKFLLKRALIEWEQKYKHLKSLEIPKPLIEILEKKLTKKEQIAVLKNLTINTDQLLAFLISAGEDYQYTFSQYRADHLPKGFEGKKLPVIAELKANKEIDSIGNTDLSKGQIKEMITQRHVTIAKFLDKGEIFHCLFLTYKSLGGEESYKGGKSHFHYISNSWGLSREEVLSQLKSRKYSLPSLPHINYEKY